jgi:hypothetical protein
MESIVYSVTRSERTSPTPLLLFPLLKNLVVKVHYALLSGERYGADSAGQPLRVALRLLLDARIISFPCEWVLAS